MPVVIERDRLEIAPALGSETVFPVEYLPPVMRAAVEALEYHVQAPRSLCAHSILSAAMLACQGLADVDVRALPQPRPLSLFMLVIAVSGERKSACDDLALHAISQHEAQMRLEHAEAEREYRIAQTAYEAEKKHIERDTKLGLEERTQKLRDLREPVEPLLPVIRAKEPNLEGLLNVLQRGRASIGIFTSEGGQFLGGHGMGEEAKTRTITGLSELWDAGSAQRVRARETLFLTGRRVGISLAAQPKVASALLGDELARDQGFVGRFLVTMPDSTIGTRQVRETEPRTDARLSAFYRQCRRLLNHPLPLGDGTRNELHPPVIGLTPEAWKVWQGLAQNVEQECGAGGRWLPVRSAALKLAENVARIAGILALFEDPELAVREGEITGETMAAACAVGLFYLQEALRLTGHAVLDPETRALNELSEWLCEKYGAGAIVPPSTIQRLAPAHLRTDAETLRSRLERLTEFGAIEPAGRQQIDDKWFRETYRIVGEEG
ncbi:YfjI family protein [Methylobacterium oxalidis]|uniref:DUF3987 domain-containing protein n=1 Tax=Methylobacterium oxalidis TaxID=944322 RepID=A0A512J9G9_9HYPH|nr:YfjI family protein [Methylobacterium oxalidis]GEP06621.1 hypothetical protein MOX02_46590 [Methylobacterium oxalidis]GLS66235.1 hypothetical protein GCM10007888_46170 [Methylobacterium oxalidis]